MKKVLWLIGGCVLILVVSSMFVDSSDILLYRIYGAIICFLVVFIAWLIMAYYLLKPEPKVKNENMSGRYKEVSLEEISKYGVDTKIFKKNIYQKFVDIQMALSNMDMDILKKYLTDDLYKAYVIELDDLKNENKKIICKNIELVDIKIYNIEELYGVLHIDIYLNVRMVDYIIEMDTDKCVSGNYIDNMEFEFELNFIKKMDTDNNDYLLSNKICINKMEIEKLIDK